MIDQVDMAGEIALAILGVIGVLVVLVIFAAWVLNAFPYDHR